jgi:hypothetical protein
MRSIRYSPFVLLTISVLCCFLTAQQVIASVASSTVVPRLVNFSGKAMDERGKPISGITAATFAIYNDQQGGPPLWMETQNVTVDKNGHYTAQLGATKPDGLAVELFSSGEARWLGVTLNGGKEQPRTLLLSVPYALKALDAETIGGRPASSFMLAPAASTNSSNPHTPPGTITGSGTTDFVPMFTGATTIGNSKIFQTVGGNVGIATKTPAAKLDVKGTEDVRDTLTLFPNSPYPALYLHGTSLSIDHTGLLTFVSGQTFPGTGTVASVGSGAGLTGGPITTSGTLSIKTGGVSNTMLANPSLTVGAGTGLSGGGSVSLGGSTTLSLASNTCASGTGLTALPFTCSPFATLGANTFAGDQTVNGNLYATGISVSSSNATGVSVSSSTGVGVYATYSGASGVNYGVWGDGGTIGWGVVGSTQDGYAGYFTNLSYYSPTLQALNEDSYGLAFQAGGKTGDCQIDAIGDLACTGNITPVVAIDGGARKVALSAIESPKNWFEDAGSAQLVNGSAIVELDPDFIQTVNTEMEYMVFPVPKGDCKGLYISHQTPTSFEVHELGGGTSSVHFYYRIMALRNNYENVRFADHTKDPVPTKDMHRRGSSAESERQPVSVRKMTLIRPSTLQVTRK